MECQYAKSIVTHLNKREKRKKVIEIGCGLGNILRHLRYNERIGIDRDINALKAFSFFERFSLFKNKAKLIQSDIVSIKKSEASDAIILVNWIHEIDPSTLKDHFAKLFVDFLKLDGEIIFDTVSQNTYMHNHDAKYLTEGLPDADCVLIGTFDRGRNIYSIKKLKDLTRN
jgi:SAM-dependent methyltransferase